MASLALSHTPLSYLRYLFFIHQIWTADKLFFFLFLLRACLFAACHIFPCSFSSSLVMIIWRTSESFATFTQERVGSAEKWSFDRHCNEIKIKQVAPRLCFTPTLPGGCHRYGTTVIPKVCQGQSTSWNKTVLSSDDGSMVGKSRSYLRSCVFILIVSVVLWINGENILQMHVI